MGTIGQRLDSLRNSLPFPKDPKNCLQTLINFKTFHNSILLQWFWGFFWVVEISSIWTLLLNQFQLHFAQNFHWNVPWSYFSCSKYWWTHLYHNPGKTAMLCLKICVLLWLVYQSKPFLSSQTMHCGRNRPFACHSKIFHSMNYKFGSNFKVQLYPLWL